ncbi:MAG: PaaI family thioesterase [Ignavibacterium sp.]|nr:PaaI family thioesterase [Ignavibacterium sp.]MCX7612052.1 PaaI family thioesterase [Ignavibacterium sp.]MDW8375306.1 PaaI family thioesterase [Ignavibacteriales bacterium]
MNQKAVQDFYPEDFAQCYGCGRLNEFGHQIKTYWDGDETVTKFTPKPYHTALPGYVYGGLLASLIDCHGTGSAALAAFKNENRDVDTLPPFRFVTASLQVDYLKPTPIGVELEIRGRIVELKGRKVVTEISLFANGIETVKGKVIAVQVPEHLIQK